VERRPPGGERRQLEERRAAVEQQLDAFTRQQLAARPVPGLVALATTGPGQRELLLVGGQQRQQAGAVRRGAGRGQVDRRAEDRHLPSCHPRRASGAGLVPTGCRVVKLSATHISGPVCPVGRGRCTVDFAENPDHVLLRETVAELAAGFGHEYFAEQTRTGGKTHELWQALSDHGFLSVHLPEEHGGGGGGITELSIVCEEVAAQGCPLLLILVSAAICGELISRFGTDAQRTAWLPDLIAGERMAFAITEPDAGSNSHNISTTARRDGDVFVLRGTKTYISGVDESSRLLVVTRTGVEEQTGRGRLSLFVVDSDAPGLSRTLIPVEIAAPEKQFTLFFDDVVVPADRLLGEQDDGLRVVFFGLNPERITGAAISTGIGRYAMAKAAAYARDRRVWDVPIGTHQGVAHPLAEAKIQLELARLMTARAAWLHDHDGDRREAGEAANMAKFSSADAGLACLDAAIQAHGGNGMASEYGLADLWGLARLLRIAPISREMILNFVAQHSLGLPKSY
jgi:alkylation response protein AidB-like acyl-CoA dehydrogenase